jgi:Putative zinc-finger
MESDRTVSLDHDQAAELIPWLVNGTLAPEQTAALRRHLQTCEHCRADLEEQRQVHEAMRAEGPLLFAAEASFHKLLPRLQSGHGEPSREHLRGAGRRGEESAAPSRHPGARASVLLRWVAVAAAVEALALGIGGYLWASSGRTPPAPYYTLTSPTPSYREGERMRAVFKSELSLGQLQILLHSVNAHIIDGPTGAGVYTLGFPASVDAAMAHERILSLRARASVLFAEPVSGDSS